MVTKSTGSLVAQVWIVTAGSSGEEKTPARPTTTRETDEERQYELLDEVVPDHLDAGVVPGLGIVGGHDALSSLEGLADPFFPIGLTTP